jgi:DNA-binding CsgD family transcriptional regulator
LIGRHTACNSTTLAEFGAARQLSRAEQRLLPAICAGAGIKEMAKQQRISAFTVRTHLTSIRNKTGAVSLRTLMLQLTTLPPLRSLHGDQPTH